MNLNIDMDTTLRVVIRMNLMEQSWLVVNEEEMVFFVFTEIRFDVICDKFSLNRFVVIIVSFEN